MNVLVVAAHGLNCHWLGPYGNNWVATPATDALATESVVFDRHFTEDPRAGALSCPQALLTALRAAGVTVAMVDDRKNRSAPACEWDLVVRTDPERHSTPAAALLAAVRSALDQLAGRSPWLLWINTDRLLPPWDLELETYQQYASTSGGFAAEEQEVEVDEVEPTDTPTTGPFDVDNDGEWHRLRNSFGAAVTSFDAELADLFREFRSRGLVQSATWIVTSDCGYPLGEHGLVGPTGSRMHEELVHLPLIVRLPASQQAMRRVPVFTMSSDLTPTIAELFGVAIAGDRSGRSIVPLTVGTVSNWRQSVRSSVDSERAIRTDEWAFLPTVVGSDRPARLYHKPDDIWEVNDLAPRHPDECDRLAALLDESLEENR